MTSETRSPPEYIVAIIALCFRFGVASRIADISVFVSTVGNFLSLFIRGMSSSSQFFFNIFCKRSGFLNGSDCMFPVKSRKVSFQLGIYQHRQLLMHLYPWLCGSKMSNTGTVCMNRGILEIPFIRSRSNLIKNFFVHNKILHVKSVVNEKTAYMEVH